MKHEMKLNNDPFLKMKDGTKKIEMRLYDEKRKKIKIGDYIEFTNRENNEKLLTQVLNLYVEKSFEELYSMFKQELLGYNPWEVAIYTDMEQFYSKKDIEKYGVVGIEIKLV